MEPTDEGRPTRVTARRTVLREGAGPDYARVHARIPVEVERALRMCGVVRWQIWRDGRFLFHSIETTAGYEAMVDAIGALGPIDAEWDAVIAALLDPDPASDVILDRVWSMDPDGQH